MSNQLYGKGRNKFAQGDIHWKASGGDTIKVILVDAADYAVQIDTHEFLSDVPAAARVAIAQLTLLDPVLGVCDGQDLTLPAVSGDPSEALVIFKDTGVEGTSPLLAYIDQATGLPVTPNGGDITVQWDNGANKIFKL